MGFKTAAFLGGAAQGLNVLGQGMLRQVERDAEQGIWEKRQALLSEIQRENARVGREDQAAFDDKRFPVKVEQEGLLVSARGKAQTAAEVAKLNSPELQGAQAEAATRAQEQQIALLEARSKDPRVQAAEKAEIDKKLDLLRRETGIRADGQIRVVNATESAREQRAAKADKNPLLEKFKDYKEATGTELPDPVKKQLADAYVGLGKVDDGAGKKALDSVLKGYENGTIKAEEVGAQLGVVMRSLRVDPAEQGIREEVNAARKSGKVGEVVAAMRAKGFKDEQLSSLFTLEELKSAPTAAPASPAARRQASAPIDPIASMNERTLRQIAGIQGHASQAAAKAELNRRRAAAVSGQEEAEAAASLGYGGV